MSLVLSGVHYYCNNIFCFYSVWANTIINYIVVHGFAHCLMFGLPAFPQLSRKSSQCLCNTTGLPATLARTCTYALKCFQKDSATRVRFHDSIHDSTIVVAMAAAHTLGKLAKVRDKTDNHHVRIGFIPMHTMRKIALHSKSGPNPASSYT